MADQLHSHDKGILPRIGHQIVAIHDWLAGSPMSEHDRLNREIAQTEALRRISNQQY